MMLSITIQTRLSSWRAAETTEGRALRDGLAHGAALELHDPDGLLPFLVGRALLCDPVQRPTGRATVALVEGADERAGPAPVLGAVLQ